MSLLFMSSNVLSPCLYLCTHASGGLILIAHQASKCLCLYVFLVSDSTDWQICSMYRLIHVFSYYRNKICYVSSFASWSFDFWCLFSFAECLALWQGGQELPQKTCVTCLQRQTLSNQLWPLSTLSTKSCQDHSYADEKGVYDILTTCVYTTSFCLHSMAPVLGCMTVSIRVSSSNK